MRSYEKLTLKEKKRAQKVSLNFVVECIVFGIMEIKLTKPKLQIELNKILDRSINQPRLATLRILLNKPIVEDIRKIALIHATESKYNKFGDRIIKENLQ